MHFDLDELSQTQPEALSGGQPDLGWKLETLGKGQQAGCQLLTLNCGDLSVKLVPTRGMGIWQAQNGDLSFKWDSPIDGPVHPMWVPVGEPSGLGWLDGFDELMVRCGLASNGAPEFDDSGALLWPLHGRIANLPAHDVTVDIDEAKKTIEVKAKVNENRFHFQKLQLQTAISLAADSNDISIVDTVVNQSNRHAKIQMLYHCNFGSPVLTPGSELFAPIQKLVPRNDHAADGIKNWNQFGDPDPTYAEQVYFAELVHNADGNSIVVLANKERSAGASVKFDAATLPYFTLWKNTVGLNDGYVVGLEPGTNFPNPRSFEGNHGREISLTPGQSHTMRVQIGLLNKPDAIESAISQVDALSIDNPVISEQPTDDWCAP